MKIVSSQDTLRVLSHKCWRLKLGRRDSGPGALQSLLKKRLSGCLHCLVHFANFGRAVMNQPV